MRLEARDKRALIIGAIVVVALLAYLLWPRETDQSGIELVAADQRKGTAAAAVPPATPPPPVVATVPVPGPAAPAAAAPAGAIPEGLSLAGVAGSGAIFSFADGTQRFIGRGREVVPGITLQAVRLRDVLLAASTTNYRLPLGGTAVAVQPPPAAAAPVAAPGAPGNAMGAPSISSAEQQAMGQQFAVALAPREAGGRITGWTVRSDVNMPALAQAGLQPGDVLLAVNGEAIASREQIVGLPAQIANGTRVEFEFERGGQRMRRALEVNSRR